MLNNLLKYTYIKLLINMSVFKKSNIFHLRHELLLQKVCEIQWDNLNYFLFDIISNSSEFANLSYTPLINWSISIPPVMGKSSWSYERHSKEHKEISVIFLPPTWEEANQTWSLGTWFQWSEKKPKFLLSQNTFTA